MSDPRLLEFQRLTAEVRAGRPRGFEERYLMVKPKRIAGGPEQGPLVPMKYTPMQEAAYAQTYGDSKWVEEWKTGSRRNVVRIKPREAESTTLCCADLYTFTSRIPGITVLFVIDKADKIVPLIQPIFETFYDNMPEWDGVDEQGRSVHYSTKTDVGKLGSTSRSVGWDSTKIEFVFPLEGGGQVSSFIVFASSGAPDTARSGRVWMVVRSEDAFYDRSQEAALNEAIRGSLVADGISYRESTPNGREGGFYKAFRAIEDNQVAGTVVFTPWYVDPGKVLRPGGAEWRLVAGKAWTEEERGLVGKFPQDGIESERRINWRRYEIQERIAAYGEESRAKVAFLREYPEDKLSCWQNPSRLQFNPNTLSYLGGQVRPPLRSGIVSGLDRRIWAEPVPGHVYVAGMDFATPQGDDATTLQVLDATVMTFVAELYSRGNAAILDSVMEAVTMCREYNNAWYAPEANTVGAGTMDEARRVFEYARVYRRPLEPGENPESPSFINRAWGWMATKNSVMLLWAEFQSYFNKGMLQMPNKWLVDDIHDYNPQNDPHWPDRMRAAAIAVFVAKEKGLLGAPPGSEAQRERAKVLVLPGPRRPYFAGG